MNVPAALEPPTGERETPRVGSRARAPRRPRSRSLRLELVANLAIVLVMAAVSLSLAGEMLGQRRHTTAEAEALEDHADRLTTLLTPLADGARYVSGDAVALLQPSVGHHGIVAIEVYRLAPPRPGAPPAVPLVQVGLPTELPPPTLEGATGTAQTAAAGTMLVVDARPRGLGAGPGEPLVLRIVAQPAPWTRATDWTAVLLLAAGVGVVLLVIGSALLENQVIGPLRAIQLAVRRVANGDLDARAPDEGPAELQALAADVNRMTSALREQIAEIEAQRQRLVRAEQLAMVGRVSAGVAHEVGNPLAAVLGYVDLLLHPAADSGDREQTRAMLEGMRKQLLRMRDTVGQLLDYARPPTRELGPVDLGEAAQALVALVRHDPRLAGVDVRVQPAGTGKTTPGSTAGDAGSRAIAWGDRGMIEQVLQNLLVNAARATRSGPARAGDPPRVDVRVGVAGAVAFIEVQDDGEGVPDDVRERLFEPFFTTAPAGEGSGLGLPICQGLAERMGGALLCLARDARPPLRDADHDRPGATFRLELPRAASPTQPASDASSAAAPGD